MSEQPLFIPNMRPFYSPTLWTLLGTCLLLGFILLQLLTEAQAAADGNGPQKEPSSPNKSAPPPSAQPAPPPKQAAKKSEKAPKKKLSGAELYALHCNRCHPERYAPERTAEQWKTILLHMRTRANLPAEQARAILQYLQEDSGK